MGCYHNYCNSLWVVTITTVSGNCNSLLVVTITPVSGNCNSLLVVTISTVIVTVTLAE